MSIEHGRQISLGKEPRIIDFTLHPTLEGIIRQKNTQVVNLLVGGNVPESERDLKKVLGQELNLEALKKHDLTPPQIDAIEIYNADQKNDRKVRFVDTAYRAAQQYEAIKENIRSLVDRYSGKEIDNIVFTVCGATPPDLQALRAIQEINNELDDSNNQGEKRPKVYAAMFLTGAEDEEDFLKYSIRVGLQQEMWEMIYEDARAADNIFIHQPHFVEEEGTIAQFGEIRKRSEDRFGHNRAGNVDVNRTITETAGKPPAFGILADSLAEPRQLRGSSQELIARILWMQQFNGLSFEEAFKSITLVQDGFVYSLPWTYEEAQRIFERLRNAFDEENEAGIWPRGHARRIRS